MKLCHQRPITSLIAPSTHELWPFNFKKLYQISDFRSQVKQFSSHPHETWSQCLKA